MLARNLRAGKDYICQPGSTSVDKARCGVYAGGMKIDARTPQAELLKLSESALRRDVLKSTPLNLRHFLRYMVLFLLFPGMVFGFAAGMAVTVCFCALLIGVLVWGSPAAATVSIYSWLALGIGVLVFVQAGVIRKCLKENKRRRQYRAAQKGLKHPQPAPSATPLRWAPSAQHKDFLVASLVFSAPQKGVYAFLLTVKNYDGRRIITGGVTGTTIVHAEGKPGAELRSLTLYRLEAGRHELTWAVPAGKGAPQAELTLLNRAETNGDVSG